MYPFYISSVAAEKHYDANDYQYPNNGLQKRNDKCSHYFAHGNSCVYRTKTVGFSWPVQYCSIEINNFV
jgi:hypothetical protein